MSKKKEPEAKKSGRGILEKLDVQVGQVDGKCQEE
jgi:hypothetical protein